MFFLEKHLTHCALCIAHCTLCIVHRALCVVPVRCDMCIVHYTVHCALCVAYCALRIVPDNGGRPKAAMDRFVHRFLQGNNVHYVLHNVNYALGI